MLNRGRYDVRVAKGDADLDAVFKLRGLCFGPAGAVRDAFDDRCQHLLVMDTGQNRALCSFRILLLPAKDVKDCYSAQFYDLSALTSEAGNMLELGRFCVNPDLRDPDILRIAWGALTKIVDQENVGMLFGCSSFPGTDPTPYLDAFAVLKARHLGPVHKRPGLKSATTFNYGDRLDRKPDAKQGMAQMPALLRTYLMMGGWVSDHAVIDHHLNTLHVFTGLNIAAVPDARKRLLRAVAG